MNSSPKSVAIIGAGVIGLSVGWALARAGMKVRVFDKGSATRQSSWAAAGMLAVAAETEPGHETFFALARASRERWGTFAAELEAESDREVFYEPGQTLVAAQCDEEAAHLRKSLQYLRTLDEPARLIKAPRDLEPELASDVTLGLLVARDGQVDNRALGRALHIAVTRAGGEIHENALVQDVLIENGRVNGVRVAGNAIEADHVIIAAGCWSSTSFPSVNGVLPTVHPVKGQMIAFQTKPGRLRHIVWGAGVYIVPRRDGRIIVGATMEERGFDTSTVPGVIEAQKAKAAAVLPFLGDLDVVDSWAGLRPGSPDGLPIIGPSAIEGLSLATGHFRNGILLAPITADLVARSVLEGEPAAALLPFLPERFALA